MRRLARLALAALILAAGMARAPGAYANAPAPFVRSPERLGGAFIVQPTTLVVEHEDLTFQCADVAAGCSFEATYHVRNDGDAREEVLGAFYGIASNDVKIAANGIDASHPLTPEQIAAMDATVSAIDPAVVRSPHPPGVDPRFSGGLSAGALGHTGFTLAVDGHSRATLVFTGQTQPVALDNPIVGGEFLIAPLTTRHPVLSSDERAEQRYEFAYALSPIRSWGGSPDIDITVRFPASLGWDGEGLPWVRSTDRDQHVARIRVAAHDASILRFRVVRSGTTLLSGGLLAAVGGRLDARELRLRLGYEMGYPSWVIYSAAVETSLHGHTTLVPAVEAATPDLVVVIPSLAVGVGVPVQIRSGAPAVVGARVQLAVAFPFLSMIVPFDWFPGASGGDRAQVSMMGQVSF